VRILGFEITRVTKQTPPLTPIRGSGGGWWYNLVREPYTGAWQRNDELRVDSVLSYFAVFACVTLIASDIGKVCLRLVEEDEDDIWTPVESPAFSPVLRRPNRYQTINKFLESWITSKLIYGNTYVLLERDARGVVVGMFVLDPKRVTVLVAPDGAVFYQLRRDDLSGLTESMLVEQSLEVGILTVPASEIIHDTMITLWHPLIGVTPIYACGLSALQGLNIQSNSSAFFTNGSHPGGILTAPGAISDETAQRLKAYFDTNFTGVNAGKVAVLGDGLTYQDNPYVNAVDAQLIDQLKWTGETVCACFHVPPPLAIPGQTAYQGTNIEPLVQQYYAQCLQSLMTNLEKAWERGVGLEAPVNGRQLGVEFDVDDLIWMDTATRTKSANESIGAGALSPNEARKKYFGVGPVDGGDSPMMQQQYYSLAALAQRDAEQPFAKPRAGTPPAAPPEQKTFDVGRTLALIEADLDAA